VLLFGRRVSWDAIIVAGATALGIVIAYNLSKSGGGLSLGVPPNAGTVDPGSMTPNPSAPADTTAGSIALPWSSNSPGTTLGVPQSSDNGTPQPGPQSGGGGGVVTVPPSAPAGPAFRPPVAGGRGGPQMIGGDPLPAAPAAPAVYRAPVGATRGGPQMLPEPPATVTPNVPYREPIVSGRGGPRML